MELPSPSRRLLSFIPLFALIAISVSSLEISGTTVTIHNASDFIELSENVNSGITTYSGSTVLLGDDIDFADYSDMFNPIGTDPYQNISFYGSFDGQGHTISNLVVNSSWRYVALFGATNATSFKNLVVDSSCSFLNTHDFTHKLVYASGIIAFLYPTEKTRSVVEGCVNMADVTYDGENLGEGDMVFTIGGVVASVLPNVTHLIMRDCVNYGAIAFYGECSFTSIGGVLGAFFDEVLAVNYDCIMTNCANYGRLVHNGETKSMLAMGGIVGVLLRGSTKNCINYEISQVDQEVTAVGKVSGGTNGNIVVDKCFWTNKTDADAALGFIYNANPKITDSYFVESNTTTLDLLNSWVSEENGKESEYKYTKWMMLHLGSGGGMNTVREETLIVPQLPFPAPSREGHSFIHWCTDSECSTGEYNGTLDNVTDLYAMWKANNYTVTFNYGNGTLVSESFTFNTTIIYPEAPRGEGIYGWNNSIEKMPAYDIVIGPNTTPPPKSSKSNVGAIAGGVVGGVIGVALVVLVVLFFVLKKSNNESNSGNIIRLRGRERSMRKQRGGRGGRMGMERRGVGRRVGGNYAVSRRGADEATPDGEAAAGSFANSICLDTLYPGQYRIPSLAEALVEAGLDKTKTQIVIDTCEGVGKDASSSGTLADNFTEADAAAIAMYTFEFDPEESEYNPYSLINKALMCDGDPESIRGLLYLVMCALRKLPKYKDRLLYRGLKSDADMSTYKNGSIVMWPTIVSTSPDMKAAKQLIEDEENEGSGGNGTLFVIEDAWGYNIQSYSLFPEDGEEILLEPERRFQVTSVIESETTIVNLKMLDTPLVLPHIFGGGNDE